MYAHSIRYLLHSIDEDEVVRIAACEGLGYLDDRRALSALEYVYEHDDAIDEFGVTVKETALEAIKRLGGRA